MSRFYKLYIKISGIRIYLLLITFSLASLISNIISMESKREYGEICLKDFIINYSYSFTPYMFFPVMTLVLLIYIHKMSQFNRVIRYKKMEMFYVKLILGICIQVTIGLAISFAIVLAGGIIYCGFVADNWQNDSSYAMHIFNRLLIDTPLFKLIVAEILSFFVIILINALVCLIVDRYTRNLILGYFISMAGNVYCLFLSEHRSLSSFYITRTVYREGWNANSLIFPVVVVAVLVLFSIFMGKRDYIKKG